MYLYNNNHLFYDYLIRVYLILFPLLMYKWATYFMVLGDHHILDIVETGKYVTVVFVEM